MLRNIPTLSPLLCPAASSPSTSLAHRLLNKKKPTNTPLSPLSTSSPLPSRWATIFNAPHTQSQLSILLPTPTEAPFKTTVGKRITFSESVVFNSPRRSFSSSSTSAKTATPPVPISSCTLCIETECSDAPTSDSIGKPQKKLTPTTTSDFEFLVGASWAPKTADSHGAASKENKYGLNKRSFANDEFATIPKIFKTKKVDAGDDAFFGVKLQNHVALGVADGVGGWSEVGVDPSEFSWSLMNNIAATAMNSVSKPSSDESSILEPINLLETGYAQVLRQREVKAGSSTASILTLCAKTGMLRSANLGDSSYIIIRDLSKVIYQPAEQQHSFNFPYQLSICIDDKPRDAEVWQESLKHGDVVVLATDGFFDNVDVAAECIPSVRKSLARWIAEGGLEKTTGSDKKAYRMAEACAQKLTKLAVSYSNDPKRRTPFSKNARIHGYNWPGGKIDDVTILVAIVRRTG